MISNRAGPNGILIICACRMVLGSHMHKSYRLNYILACWGFGAGSLLNSIFTECHWHQFTGIGGTPFCMRYSLWHLRHWRRNAGYHNIQIGSVFWKSCLLMEIITKCQPYLLHYTITFIPDLQFLQFGFAGGSTEVTYTVRMRSIRGFQICDLEKNSRDQCGILYPLMKLIYSFSSLQRLRATARTHARTLLKMIGRHAYDLESWVSIAMTDYKYSHYFVCTMRKLHMRGPATHENNQCKVCAVCWRKASRVLPSG